MNLKRKIITLSNNDRVALSAPSGRPNGKQYLKTKAGVEAS